MRSNFRFALLTTLSAVAVAAPVYAQDAADENAETIIVTGSRSASRTVENSPVPVDVLNADAITEGGQVETNKILNKLVPSFNFPQPAIADGSDALRPATLRGLGPDQTLVLVNGKRRHLSALLNVNGTVGRGSAAVDMNAIPALAIERIEVLRDGASSQYGSDAIAGVINVRLKSGNEGGKAAISYGRYETTIDGVDNITGLVTANGQAQLMTNDSRYFQATVDGQRKASDGESYSVATNIGLPFFGVQDGYINLTAEYRHRGYTNRQGYDLRPNYVPSASAFDDRELTFNRLQFRLGDPQADDFILFANMAAPLSDSLEFYAFGSFNQRDSLSAANYRPAVSNNYTAGTNTSVYSGNGANRDWSALAPNEAPTNANYVGLTADGYLPFIQSDLSDAAVAAGIRTTAGEWNVDGSFSFGRNSFDYQVENSVNASFGPDTKRSFDAGGLRYRQMMVNLDVSREFDLGFAKPLNLAFGGEYRNERFQIRPGELQSWGIGPYFKPAVTSTSAECDTAGGVYVVDTGKCTFPGRGAGAGAQGFPGLPASSLTDAKRHSFAGYLELDTDIVSGFSTTAAARFEHYSDFGDTLTAKFAARYEFTPGFAVRGSVSNGFRAPSLHQQYFTTTSTNFVSGVPVDISTVAVNSPIAKALGSNPLKPEKSLNLSGGFTASPFSGLTLTVDYYNIRINDRIVLTENLGAKGTGSTAVKAAVKAILDQNGFQSVGAARFFINGLNTRTQGVDAVLNWRLPFEGLGKWSVTAAYNYNHQKILAYKNDLGALAAIKDLVLFGRQESIRFTEGQPRDKVVLSLDGELGKFGITARTTRYGKVVSPGAVSPLGTDAASLTAYGPDDIFLGAKWISDLELRFKPFETISFAIGADNLFDVYPDRSPWGKRPADIGGAYPANQQYIPFSNFSPFGFNGRYLYARVGVDF